MTNCNICNSEVIETTMILSIKGIEVVGIITVCPLCRDIWLEQELGEKMIELVLREDLI